MDRKRNDRIRMKMKKILLVGLAALTLSGCADQNLYKEAIIGRIDQDPDIKDYKIDPDDMASCVVDKSSKKMPGLFAFDPDRMMAYRNYAKLLTVKGAEDPEKAMQEVKTSFGSAKAVSEAHTNYTNSFMMCIEVLVQKQ